MKRYTKLIFCFTVSFVIAVNAIATINPLYKECSQRGYQIDGEYCVFPDSTRCTLEDFNEKKCGEKWMTDDYCIPEGKHVWDSDRCCEGLVAYLPEGMAGQATCQKKSEVTVKKVFFDSSFRMIGLIVLVLLGTLFFLRRKNRNH